MANYTNNQVEAFISTRSRTPEKAKTPVNSGTAALLQPWNGTLTPDALKK